MKLNYFIHIANVMLLAAYSVRDVLWLRLLAAVSSLISIPYFALQPSPLWVPIVWNAIFAAINLVQLWNLLAERRTAGRSRKSELSAGPRFLAGRERFAASTPWILDEATSTSW